MTAAEALRYARATIEHGHNSGRMGSCAFSSSCRNAPEELYWLVDFGLDHLPWHEAGAAILLDGFSVDEITKAGG